MGGCFSSALPSGGSLSRAVGRSHVFTFRVSLVTCGFVFRQETPAVVRVYRYGECQWPDCRDVR